MLEPKRKRKTKAVGPAAKAAAAGTGEDQEIFQRQNEGQEPQHERQLASSEKLVRRKRPQRLSQKEAGTPEEKPCAAEEDEKHHQEKPQDAVSENEQGPLKLWFVLPKTPRRAALPARREGRTGARVRAEGAG